MKKKCFASSLILMLVLSFVTFAYAQTSVQTSTTTIPTLLITPNRDDDVFSPPHPHYEKELELIITFVCIVNFKISKAVAMSKRDDSFS
jgi:hypothetical protein